MSNGRKLRRSTDDRMIAGVAAGVADFYDIDTTLVRVVWAISAVFGGFGIVLYLVMWIIVPSADSTAPPPSDPPEETEAD